MPATARRTSGFGEHGSSDYTLLGYDRAGSGEPLLLLHGFGKFPLGAVMNKALTLRGAQQHGHRYIPEIATA
jgi:hypothetical protein